MARLMMNKGLFGRQQRRRRGQTPISHAAALASNRLAEAPDPSDPNQGWVTAITYIQTDEGWLYLAKVWDLDSR